MDMTRPARLAFVDALRGLAVVLMVVNHTARWWLDPAAGAARDRLIYATMVLAGPTFLLLVGYSLALSFFDATVVRGRRPAEVALATLRRGLAVLAVGVGLNLVVFPHDALGARVLHSIGLGIVAATPLVGLLPHRAARSALIPAALLLYAAFMPSLPALRDWSAAHPLAAALLLREYPLFPWFGLLLIGMALGWTTVTERDAGQRARSHRVVGVTGLAGLVVFALADRSTGLADRLAFARDLTLNDYWTAAPLTALGMLGGLLCLLAAAYELVERRTWRPRGLLVLGRTALMVYVVHLVLVLPVGVRAGGIVLSGWPAYWAATGALLVLLVGVGTAWSAVRLTVSSPVWYKGRTSAKGRAPNLREGRVREA